MRRSAYHGRPIGERMTQEAMSDLLREQEELCEDRMVIRYNHPDEATMRELIKYGTWYEGEWYHSYVTFSTREEQTPERQRLRAEIERMGATRGFYLLYEWEPEPLRRKQGGDYDRLPAK